MPSSLVKTIRAEPIAMQMLTINQFAISSVIDVSQSLAGRVYFDTATLTNTFGNAPPPWVEIQGSKSATGNDGWFVVKQRMAGSLPALSPNSVSAAITAGDTTCTVVNATWSFNFIQTVFIWDPTFSLSEWNRISFRSGNVNTMIDPFLNSHPITTTQISRGLRETFAVDLFSLTRIRIAVYNTNTTNVANAQPNTVAVRVALTTTDSLT